MIKSNLDMVSTPVFRAVIELLRVNGVNISEVLTSSNTSLDDIDNLEHQIPITLFDEALEKAAKLLNTPSIGLDAGQHFNIQDRQLLELLLCDCQTTREAISLMRKYYGLVAHTQSPDFIIGQNTVKIIFYLSKGTDFGNQA